jgi:isoquinoline 1-oxidoreductase alpha subunit
MDQKFKLTINGEEHEVQAPADMALLWVLRDKLGINGPKYGCGVDVCKSCTCLIDGKKQTACSISVGKAAMLKKPIITIEGLAASAQGGAKVAKDGDALHVVQQVWIELDVAQCGFCQPGQIMAAVDLLRNTPGFRAMTDDQKDKVIDEKMDNVCRCGTYDRIRKAIKIASDRLGTATA